MATDQQPKMTQAEENLARQKKEFDALLKKAKDEKSKIDKVLESVGYTDEKGKAAMQEIPKEQAAKIEKFAASLMAQHNLPGTVDELEKFVHHEVNKISIKANNPLKEDKVKKTLSRKKKLV